jgi:L-lactate dehydrogenase complex protein LldG
MSAQQSVVRDEILERLERALAGSQALFRGGKTTRSLPLSPVTRVAADATTLTQQFGQKLEAAAGSYELVRADEVVGRVIDLARRWGSSMEPKSSAPTVSTVVELLSWAPHELVIPDIERHLHKFDIPLLVPDNLHDPQQRNRASAPAVGITSVEAAFASTGSVLLSSAPTRSRVASLLPPYHIMIVPTSRIYPTLEGWLERQRRSGQLLALLRDAGQVVFVTGPSKSADIELNLTLGVHGPRAVHAILFDDVG